VSHYKSNLRDIHFNLFELLGRQDILGAGPFEEMDVDTAKEILAEVDRISREDLAASFEDGDQHGARVGVVQEELRRLDGSRLLEPRPPR
jgi:hypothetical protein